MITLYSTLKQVSKDNKRQKEQISYGEYLVIHPTAQSKLEGGKSSLTKKGARQYKLIEKNGSVRKIT